MKAILVIDLPEEIKADEVKGVRITFCNGLMNPISSIAQSNTIDSIVKPLPQKYCTDGDDIEEDSYWQGWNECIEEIEK